MDVDADRADAAARCRGRCRSRLERAATTALPAVSALYALDGRSAIWTHMRGVRASRAVSPSRRYNLVMGPPLLAPGALCMVGAMGMLAAFVKRER